LSQTYVRLYLGSAGNSLQRAFTWEVRLLVTARSARRSDVLVVKAGLAKRERFDAG
jgi:hypothetical protein